MSSNQQWPIQMSSNAFIRFFIIQKDGDILFQTSMIRIGIIITEGTNGYEINIESLLDMKQTKQQQLIFAYQHITDNINENILYNKSVKESMRKTMHIIQGKLEVKLNFKPSSIEGYMTCFMTLNNNSNNDIDINDEMEISWECDGVKKTMSHPLYEYLIMTKSFGRRRLFPSSTKSNEIILNINIIRNPLLPAPDNKERRPIDKKDVGTRNNINSHFIVKYLDSEICTKGLIAIYNDDKFDVDFSKMNKYFANKNERKKKRRSMSLGRKEPHTKRRKIMSDTEELLKFFC